MRSRLSDFKLPFILIIEIILCLLLGDAVPEIVKSTFYALSLALKEIFVTLLPFIIFSILCANLSNLSKGAFAFTIMAFAFVVISNFCSTLIAGGLGMTMLEALSLTPAVTKASTSLVPLWDHMMWTSWFPSFYPKDLGTFLPVRLLKSVTNDMGLFAGIVCGLILAVTDHQKSKAIVHHLHHYAFAFFRRLFIPLLPLFILGYLFNMEHSGILESIFDNYISIIVMIAGLAYTYIVFLYGLGTGFHPGRWVGHIKTLIPAALTGFSTMSSASALPLVIEGVRQNTKHKDNLSDETITGVVPISINIHLIGDCFAIPILALAILMSFGMGLPNAFDFFVFTTFFVLAKFAVAAVPGGGILVMIPILEKYLGFTPDMTSLITALYILFDPIITSANVFGNGAFAGLFHRLYQKVYQKGAPQSQ